MKCLVVAFSLILSCLPCEKAFAAVTGQWDFNAGNLSATVGAPLQFRGDTANHTMFGSTTTFGIPNINGQPAQVMKFPACSPSQGFLTTHGVAPSGGGAFGNRYSVILDLYFPPDSTGFRSLWQTDVNATSDGDIFLNDAHGLGIGGQYQGSVTPGQWHRVVFTIDCTKRELGKYVDGTNVLNGPVGAEPLGTGPLQYLDPVDGTGDGRWSLDTTALLFTDNDSETGSGYVNSIQIHDRVLTSAQVNALGGPTPGGIPPVIPATIVQWDFNGNLASSTGGSNLIAAAAAPAATPGFTFTNLNIGGESAQVLSFTMGTFFRAAHGFAPNGGGPFVSSYTLIMDVMFPGRPSGWAVLWQTSTANNNDGDWFVNPSAGLGISGNYGGVVADGTWNRLTLVIDAAAGTLTSFVNGQQVQQIGGVTVDGRWSLAESALLFADENQENAAGFVNSVQLHHRALASSEVADLGGPRAAGIPVPATPTLRVLSPNGGEMYQAGTTRQVSWLAVNPSGGVQIELLRGGELY
ncbi:MAG TPA: hypothetical protein VJS65_16450, partial [Verrucomicrobiae bacterium]|nr:hypothetical protein [Verrucomicrobiae bacterium]